MQPKELITLIANNKNLRSMFYLKLEFNKLQSFKIRYFLLGYGLICNVL